MTLRHKGAEGKEPFGIHHSVRHEPNLHGCEVPAERFASIVDEVPVLALVAAHARGVTVFREVGELRVKETDRLAGRRWRAWSFWAWTRGRTATTCSWKASPSLQRAVRPDVRFASATTGWP